MCSIGEKTEQRSLRMYKMQPLAGHRSPLTMMVTTSRLDTKLDHSMPLGH